MKQIIDPVFGTLTFHTGIGALELWKKTETLELMDGPVPLGINADEDGPTQEQRQVYLTFKQAEKNLRHELQELLFEFYRIVWVQYFDACGDMEDYVENCLPVLESSDEIWGILTPLSWLIVGPETYVEQYGRDL